MQSNFETGEFSNPPQQLMDTNSNPPVLPVLFNPQKQNLPTGFDHQQVQQHQNLGNIVHPITITHELFQRQNQFQAQYQQQVGPMHWQMNPVNFKLGLNGNSGGGGGEAAPDGDNLGFKSWEPHEFDNRREPIWKQDNKGEMYKELESRYGLYGELEAIYNLAKIGEVNQSGSGSALTNETSPKKVNVPMRFGDSEDPNAGPAAAIGAANGSEASIEEEVSVRKGQKRKRKRSENEQLSSSATSFFEGLVKQVMDHQESLHNKYLELIERMDKERKEREESWRCQEAEKQKREHIAKLHEHALASDRQALIVSYIEKITGQKVNIPTRESPFVLQSDNLNEAVVEKLTPVEADHTNSRWPKSEVEALILVRSNVESKFQEQGLKGSLWEEVSASMASLGYHRSAKRCKEKWENMNKYFKKTKDSGKKQPSKTCSYFNQLDQLHSRAPISSPSPSPYYTGNPSVTIPRQGELLQAVTAGRDAGVSQNRSNGNFEFISEMESKRLNFDGITTGQVELVQEGHGNQKENQESHRRMSEVKEDNIENSNE